MSYAAMKASKLINLLTVLIVTNGCMFTEPDYLTMLTPAELKQIMSSEDIFLVDVHIPEQKHIQGTDAFIPFNDIEKYLAQLPADKNTPIYLYCEGGPMGNAAARTLHDLGYTRLYNLKGGSVAWHRSGFN